MIGRQSMGTSPRPPAGANGMPRSRRKPRPKRSRGLGCSTLDFVWIALVGGSLFCFALWTITRGSVGINADWPQLRGNKVEAVEEEETSEFYHKVKGIGALLANGRRSDVYVFDKDAVDRRDDEAEILANMKLEEEAQRKMTVKNAFLHAWNSYKKFAWGKDVLLAEAGRGKNDQFSMAGTMVDALDTMKVMGLNEEYNEARDYVVDHVSFDHQKGINLFETTIRILGGLLGAITMGQLENGRVDQDLLAKATDLADKLLPAFETTSGIPFGTLDTNTGGRARAYNPNGQLSSMSEVGTLQLEWRFLSHLTGDPKYKAAVDKAFHVLLRDMDEEPIVEDGLFPMYINPNTAKMSGGTYTLGARVDSLYEYMLKQYVQGAGQEPWLREMYERSMRGIEKHLIKRTQGKDKLLYIAEMDTHGKTAPKMDHLVCFVPGMLALGTLHSKNKQQNAHDLELAEELLNTCYESYRRSPTGLAPEIFALSNGSNELMPKGGAKHSLLRPETVESLFIMWRVTKNQIYRDMGWHIMQSFEKYARHPNGYTSLANVEDTNGKRTDGMHSFFLAETLKYLYLLFSDDYVLPLDKVVFNTEAHPMLIVPGMGL